MSNPASISGVDLTTPQGRQILQDALDILYGLIQKAGGVAAGPTTFDELRVRMLTVLGTINVVPEDKPPANVNSRLVTPWLTGQRGRGEVWRFEDQNDGGDLLEVRSQPYLVGTPTATSGDWEFRFTSAQRDPAGAYRSLGAIRFSSSGRIRTYDASETLLFDSTLALTASTAPLPKRFISGLVILGVSATTFRVLGGKCRNRADSADMTWAPATVAAETVTQTTAGALGYESKNLSGTASFTSGANTVTGSGTAFLTEFAPSNVRRALTGTISSSGGTITGTGTKFLTELAAGPNGATGDLIGTAAKGLWQVTAINSDTSCTISLAGGASDPGFSADSPEVVENPWVETAGGRNYSIERITSNTALRILTAAAANEAGVAVKASARVANPAQTYPCWRSVWLVSGGSGTTVVMSTQRTAPLCVGPGTVSPSGYGTSYRRIGWVLQVGTTHDLMLQRGSDTTAGRWTYYNDDNGSTYVRIVSNANIGAPVDYCANTIAPPTAQRLYLLAQQYAPNVANPVYYGPRGASSTILYVWTTSTTGFASLVNPTDCDGAQWITLTTGGAAATGDGTFMDIYGYEDTLE